MNSSSTEAKWLRDLRLMLHIRAQFILTGNIRDLVILDETNGDNGVRLVELPSVLWELLEPLGFQVLLGWDPVLGLRVVEAADENARTAASKLAGMDLSETQPMGLEALSELIRGLQVPDHADACAAALIVDFTSRLREQGRLPDDVRRLFLAAEKAALDARMLPRDPAGGLRPQYNPIIWLANRPNDVPYWLTVESERIRHIPIPLPDADSRKRIAESLYANIRNKDVDIQSFASDFSRLTHNTTATGMCDIIRLARVRQIPASDIDDAVESFRIGDLSLTSPWRGQFLRDRIRKAEADITKRIKGQDKAVSRVLDTLKRTSIGLTGAQAGRRATRPRGVLFFVGPTGVGKTEMAKSIAEVVFGDESAYLRFDMSEFSAEHSGDRLIGAPPGYVGFDQGGELTNAMREKPFRVLLFDEVDKAHQRILDKFLQILEDGRLTDGRGETVYFSESLIIFTSNKGVQAERADGTFEYLVSAEDSPEEYERKIMAGVRRHFVEVLQRPEILNRLGENVVPFNFIHQDVAEMIFERMLENVKTRIEDEHRIEVTLGDEVRESLLDYCARGDLENGGRGIGSRLETAFVNPVARLIFDSEPQAGETLHIRALKVEDGVFSLEC